MTKLIITKEQFIKVLYECRDYSKSDAEDTYNEYRGDIAAYVHDINGDEENIQQIRKFLKI